MILSIAGGWGWPYTCLSSWAVILVLDRISPRESPLVLASLLGSLLHSLLESMLESLPQRAALESCILESHPLRGVKFPW